MIPPVAIDLLYDLWPVLMLLCVVIITLKIIYLKINKQPFVLYRELLSLSFLVYVILLFELVTSTDFSSLSNNIIPFKEMFRYPLFSKLFYRNVFGNIFLFFPFGYFSAYFCKMTKVRWSLLATGITSLCIELIQSTIGRSFDIDDIILNVFGGFLGYLLYRISKKILSKYPETFKNNLLLNVICIIIIVVLCLIILGIYGVVI